MTEKALRELLQLICVRSYVPRTHRPMPITTPGVRWNSSSNTSVSHNDLNTHETSPKVTAPLS